jgi:hypothetical protein
MQNNFGNLFSQVKEKYRKEGLVNLFRKSWIYFFEYQNRHFFLYNSYLKERKEEYFLPKTENYVLNIISSEQQIQKLMREGYIVPMSESETRMRLQKGAILFLIMVGRKIAARGWIATTEEAKSSFNNYSYKVDFASKEACSGGAWTNPEFRSQGLLTFLLYKRYEYLMQHGYLNVKSIVETNNIASIKAHQKFAPEDRVYGKARYIKIFGLEYWKETFTG